jgi:hypothetical protein
LPIPVAPAGILPRYDAACVAVANARTVDEVQEIASTAEALRAYARQARNRQLEIDAAELRIRADRRVGELMSGQGHTVGKAKGHRFAGGLTSNPPADGPPTLAEAGIDKNQAHRSRTMAAMPKEAFEERLKAKRHRHDRRVVLAPEVEAKAEAGGGDIEPPLRKRPREALAAENEKLSREVTTLRREVKMWKERAEAAGWKETADA